jgi:hypothetical protein
MRVIGLHGLPQSGKDTIADHLCEDHGFARIAFAGPIKDMLIAGFGLTREDFGWRKKEFTNQRIGMSPRRLMQTLGTEWARAYIDDDIWIRVASERVEQMKRYAKGIVVTDVRFENEAAWVRKQGGTIWHVIRSGAPKSAHHDHSSNTTIALHPPRDQGIYNGASIRELHGVVDDCLMHGFRDLRPTPGAKAAA